MINHVSLISCAASLPDRQLNILRKNDKKTIFSINDDHLPERRSLWRLDKKESITRLMVNCLSKALDQVNMNVNQLDCIIISLVWPKNILYEEVIDFVQQLNITCPVIPVSLGTAGGMTALELGWNQFSNPACKRVAVLAACNYVHWFAAENPINSLLSDGAACAILSYDSGISLVYSKTIQTYDYERLIFINNYVQETIGLGSSIISKLPTTIFNSCYQLCRDAGKDINDIRYFHIYDPIYWVSEVSAKILQVSQNRILTIFDKYGSLGPAQNFFALIELNACSDIFSDDLFILFGFGPFATSTSFLLSWKKIPTVIDFISI